MKPKNDIETAIGMLLEALGDDSAQHLLAILEKIEWDEERQECRFKE